MKKVLSVMLAVIILATTLLTSCADTSSESGYTVVNSSASDASALAEALGAGYKLVDKTSDIGLKGATIAVCTSDNGYPFDFSSFNDEGYILRKVDDDIIICGKNESATALALEHFEETYVRGEGELVFAAELDYVHGAADRLGKVTLNGVDISEYKIVIPADATVFEKYAAEIFRDHLFDAGGIKVEIVNDSVTESEYEIIIGNTSRAQTPDTRDYETMEFYLGVAGNDIVMDGNGYMVGGGAGKLIADYLEPEDRGDVALDAIGEGSIYEYEAREADSAILMIGDGMGFNHIGVSILYESILEFYAYDLPNVGEAITYSYDGLTDSAAAATALATGYKTYNEAIGVDLQGNPMLNIRELAYSTGARTAVLSTDVLDGATPASFLAHASGREESDEIGEWFPKISVDYVNAYVDWDLVTETQKALSVIGESGEPFFIMIEEGIIDKYSHANIMEDMCSVLARYNDTIAYTMTYAACHTDTALIITADHETGGLTERKGQYKFSTREHTNVNVPLFAIGSGTERFNGVATDNILIPTYIATIFGDNDFGHLS